MASEFGKDWRIFVKSGASFIPIGGETSFSIKRSSEKIDLSDKDSGTYGASGYGQQTIAISPSGNLKLPDAGYTALEVASKLSPPQIEIQVQRSGTIKFQSVMAVGNMSLDAQTKGAATWSCDMENETAPSVDNISAQPSS